ncbi:MAG: hypothetical protein K6F08_01560 [bacterium]|nr:hypothetical protein [bacterium]
MSKYFGVEGDDIYGFGDGYVSEKFNSFFKLNGKITFDQANNIYNAMRNLRLTGQELNPTQPLPVLLYAYSYQGEVGHAYALANRYQTWKDFSKSSRDPRNIYCLTNKEMVLHAPEIRDYFSKCAKRYVKSYKHIEDVPESGLKLIGQFLDDVNTIYNNIGQDEVTNILSESYDKQNGITIKNILNGIKSFKFDVKNNDDEPAK